MATSYDAGQTKRNERLLDGVIANMPMFRDVGRPSIELIASQARIQHHRPGALIVRQGEPLPGVIAVAYGLAKLALPRRKGEEKVLRFVGANESFGVAAALLDRPCPVDVVTLTDAMLVVIPVRPLQELKERDSTFANNLVRILAEELLSLVAEVDASTGRSSAQRLAAYLNSLAAPQPGAATCAVLLPVTKTALAARLGVTKETISRLLRDLREQGLIEMTRRKITILDRVRLAGIAS